MTTHAAAPDAPGHGDVRFWDVPDLPGLEFDPFLDEMVREDPVSRIRLPNGEGFAWLVTRYEDVKQVTNDARFSRQAVVGRSVTRLAPHFIPLEGAVGFADPPDHTRLRRSVAKAFTSRAVARVEESAQRVMDGLVDAMLAEGAPADLMAHVNGPFPLAVVSEVVGVPKEDGPLMKGWTASILSSAHGKEHSDRAKQEIGAYFTDLLCRTAPGEDTLASLLSRAVFDDELTLPEAVALAVLIQVSGAHAVTNNSANMLYALLTHPDQLRRLRDDPALMPAAIEELLRFIPHRNGVGLSRIALEDVTVAGVTIRAGDAVYASYLTANRDPGVFADPDTLDFGREQKAHLSFGHGPHYCVGPMLARLESRITLATLLDRLPGLRLAVAPEDVRWRRGALIRGPENLPVTWDIA
ncbi:cytochrome P450 [Streptomyces sp. NRRL F-5126]|uniref:cytochrome P450 n=1 Tax=Streptomyces sp. NRRL F-5126 TaxID=1463857 RepID=UPI0004CB8632|nr:cytochrome P450 [Streptomyces sp. NRRL F-5126]